MLGAPIAHSLSPVLHRAAYDELRLVGWHYRAVECDRAQLPGLLRELDAEGLAGVSLTMPLKRTVVPLLARTERLVADLAVANTVLFGGQPGEWWGANTDVPGLVAALPSPPLRAVTAPPWVLGSGATAASALAALASLGARECVVAARRPQAVDALAPVAARFGLQVDARPWARAAECAAAPVVIATTPAGATDGVAGEVSAVTGVLLDVVYDPWPTRLAAAWGAAGGRVVDGLELLVEQAAEQVRLMTGQPAPVAVMREAGRRALAARAIG